MSDVFYEMSKVTIKPVVNYTVLQIFLISSLNFTLVVAFCTVMGNISHTFTQRTLGLFKCIVYLYLVPFLNLTFLLLRKFIGGLTKSIIPALLLCLYIKQLICSRYLRHRGCIPYFPYRRSTSPALIPGGGGRLQYKNARMCVFGI